MTMLLGGEPTALTPVPRHWRGPLPHLAPVRDLPTRGGYARVPISLLHGGFSDLGVLTWAWLLLEFQGRPGETNYQEIAEKLGLGKLSAGATAKRISVAMQPLLGTWIVRTKLNSNTFTYRAVNTAPGDRYAIIRRGDLKLLTLPETAAKPSDIANFGRWQLECGQRGWTVEPTRLIAARWKVSHPTVRQSRDRLAALGLLEVVRRSESPRLSDLVWLHELYNPHWAVQDTPAESAAEPQDDPETDWKDLGNWGVEPDRSVGRYPGTGPQDPASPLEDSGELDWKISRNSIGRFPGTLIRNLTEPLTDDLSELGGTSVPTLALLPRAMADAPPPASRSEEHITDEYEPHHRRTAARLIGQHRVLAAAKPHFRAAMIKRLTSAFERGLAPGHVDRALALVVEDGDLDAECRIVQQALQQAWIDQRVGMCADCGDRDRHAPGCSRFDFAWAERAVDTDGDGHQPPAGVPRPAATDPLALLLQRPVTDSPDDLDDEAAVVDWMTVQLAKQIAAAVDREATLRAVWIRWRSALPSGKRDLLDHANEHVRYALNLRRVS